MTPTTFEEQTERLARRYELPVFPLGEVVPKIISQTFANRALPPDLDAHVRRLRDANPTWEYRLYDDADITDFVLEHYGPQVLARLERINPRYSAAKADLFRYLVMYRTGGVYLDVKSGFDRPIDEALSPDEKFLLSQWGGAKRDQDGFGQHKEVRSIPGGEFENWQITTVPGHPFLRAVIARVLDNIDRYNPWLHGSGGRGVYRVTGPIAYTLAIAPMLHRYPHRIVEDTEVGLVYAMVSGHKRHFKGHYLMRTDPIIRQRGPARLVGWLYDVARRAKRYFFG